MRVKEELSKAGYFWLPENPEKRIPGTLTISDGGKIELQGFGVFEENNFMLDMDVPLDRIVGIIEGYGSVTLDKCFYKNKHLSSAGIIKSVIFVHRAYIGVAYDEKEKILFNTFKFSVEGIDEWVGISGIQVETILEKQTTSITYTPPDEILMNLNNGMTLIITSSWELTGYPMQKEAKIAQKIYFKLTSDEEIPFEDFVSIAYRITTFIGFAIDRTVCIDEITATSDKFDIIEKTEHNIISIYYQSRPFVINDQKIDGSQMLFSYSQISKNAERIINNWIDAYDTIDPALNLYFSAKTGAHKYIDGKFLALAQGLETYHRRTSTQLLMDEGEYQELSESLIEQCPKKHQQWLSGRLQHGNELNLSKRIKDIIEPFKTLLGNSKEQGKLIRAIVDTRNYLTHYDKSLKTKMATGRDLWALCQKMEAIFQLNLLQVLGFSELEVESIIKNSSDLKHKLKENR